MFLHLVLALMAVSGFRTTAQELPFSRLTPATRSHSGQFIVHGARGLSGGLGTPIAGGGGAPVLTRVQPAGVGDTVVLNPSLVSVSCERIKREVLRQLRLPDAYRGRVTIYIAEKMPEDRQLTIQSTPFADGWQYSIVVPERINWMRFVRGIVDVVLIEIANRPGPENLFVPPLWFSEGLTTLLLGESGRELVPELNREFKDPKRSINPLGLALQKLSSSQPLSFEQLGYPTESDIADANKLAVFQGSSALFVHELFSISGGENLVGRFLVNLSGGLNWQTAFLEVFRKHFRSALEVEKWWAVQSTSRMLRDPSKFWSKEAAQANFAAILLETTSSRVGTNAPTGVGNQRLSEIILKWPFGAQVEVLERKILQLRTLFLFSPPELVDSVRDVHSILQDYLKVRSSSTSPERRGELDPRAVLLSKTASRRLVAIENSILGPP